MKSDSQKTPLLLTKLHRPTVPKGHIHRQHLHDHLNQNIERPLTLVSAAAGYGKSTLVSCWVDRCDTPSAWLSIDEHENNLYHFLTYFLTAIQSIFPNSLNDTGTLINAPALPPVSVIANSLANDLDVIERNFILVMDDFHFINDKSINMLFRSMLRHPPRPMHLVIISRKDPFLPISTLRSKSHLTEVRTHDLRFSDTEVKEYLKRALGDQFELATAAELAKKTEGWVTGLHLAILAMRRQNDSISELVGLKGTSMHVRAYLFSAVLDAQPPAVRRCLLVTAILERFTAELIDALCQPESGQGGNMISGADFITKLQDENLFLVPLDNENSWFRYHHLFQSLLQSELNQRWRPDEITDLHIRVADWFEAKGLIDEALQHALASGDILAAALIVERNRRAALSSDQWNLLLSWLDKLPLEIKQKRVGLLFSRAWTLLFSARIGEISPIIKRIEFLIDEDSTEPVLLSEINFFQGIHCYFQGEGSHSVKFFSKAMELLPESSFPLLYSEADYWNCVALHLAGQKEEAIRRLHKRIRSIDPKEGLLFSRLTFGLCFIHMLSAELLQAYQAGMQLREFSRSQRLAYAETWGWYVQGITSFQMFDLDDAQQNFVKVVENRYIKNPRAAIDAMAGLVITFEFMGKSDEADETIRLAGEYAKWLKGSGYLEIIRSCQARLALMRSDFDSASRWQRSLSKTPGNPMMLFFLEIPVITECRVLIATGAEGDLMKAMEKLNNLQQKLNAWHNTCQMIEVMVMQAFVNRLLGKNEDALELLERAVAAAMPGQWIRPFIELGQPMADLLKQLIKKNIAADYVRKILAAFGDVDAEPSANATKPEPVTFLSASAQPTIERLTNRELDIMELLVKRLQSKEIADKLFISPETVRTHLRNIYQKLCVSNRRQATARAMDLGLLPKH